MTLLGHYVRQYMHFLFYQVHIYIQKQRFTMALMLRKSFPSNTASQISTKKFNNYYSKTLVKYYIVIQRIIDLHFLNAMDLPDLKLTLLGNHTLQ